MPVHILLNPASGNGAAVRQWRRIEPLAREWFPDLAVHRSGGPGELTALAERLAPHGGILLAAGGDGTSHEVINGVMRAGERATAAVGWLPLGSGNDLARNVGIPADGRTALAGYRTPVVDWIDVGRLEYREGGIQTRRFFGNSLTVGLSVDVLRIVARVGKRFGGPMSYFFATLAALARHRPVSLELDGRPATVRFLSVVNGPAIGAGMRVAPHARLDDGQLDLMTIDPISRLATAVVLPRVYTGGHVSHPAVRFRGISRLRLAASGTLGFEIDGELAEVEGPLDLSVLPRALRVARPSTRRVNSTP
ncbi:MAG: diacylglycerol kinase family lipid kinase [Gemmatimonadetes bacterium]|nr:diacylglycerol kinase family lipid kinase [Gemmatimonadota bacterium]